MAIYKTIILPCGATVCLDDSAFAGKSEEELNALRRHRDRVAGKILMDVMRRRAQQADSRE